MGDMNKNPLVSVIVPIFNVKDYLPRCVDSILSQTYRNLDIVLVDDGSTDNSGIIADEYAAKYENRITCIHKKNGGLSDARNCGIEHSKGDYIAFIDSDDFIHTKMIETLVQGILQTDADISACDYQSFFLESELDIDEHLYESEYIVCKGFDSIKMLFSNDGYFDYAWNKLYKRELFAEIRYPKSKLMEDLGTTYRLIELSESVVYSRRKLYFYQQREGSILSNHNKRFYIDKFELAIKRYENLESKYGQFIENDRYIIFAILECFKGIYDNKDDRKNAVRIYKKIWSRMDEVYNGHIPKRAYLFYFSNSLYYALSKFKARKYL